jgi:hypothetical protein
MPTDMEFTELKTQVAYVVFKETQKMCWKISAVNVE